MENNMNKITHLAYIWIIGVQFIGIIFLNVLIQSYHSISDRALDG